MTRRARQAGFVPLAALLAAVTAPRVARAAPQFDSADGDVGALADRIWQAGVACTGWEPDHPDAVTIDQADLGWAAGEAVLDRRGLRSIRLDPGHGPWAREGALPHEVAHAWSYSHTSAVSEGVTQVLAECIARRLGLHAGTGPSIGEQPIDLRVWTPAAASPSERDAGYELARRLLARARLLLFGPEALWGPQAPGNLEA